MPPPPPASTAHHRRGALLEGLRKLDASGAGTLARFTLEQLLQGACRMAPDEVATLLDAFTGQSLGPIAYQRFAYWLHETATDFSELLPAKHQPVRIKKTEERGIRLSQLHDLAAFLKKQSDPDGLLADWYDTSPDPSAFGRPLLLSCFNLYHADYWVLRPATKVERISFVELVCVDAAAQVPLWFVSHWWGEPILDFVSCLTEHAYVRDLDEQAVYWVCAYANNQWTLGEEIVEELSMTSFKKALDVAMGTVSVIDRHAVCYSRAWCVYEVFCTIALKQGKLYDMATAHPWIDVNYDGGVEHSAVVIADGMTPRDKAVWLQHHQGECCNSYLKHLRQSHFPSGLAASALQVQVQRAQASQEFDRTRILNAVVGQDPGADPLVEHSKYEALNDALRGHFAAALWRLALLGEGADAWGQASDFPRYLRGSGLQELFLSFYRCKSLHDGHLQELGSGLPAGLQVLHLGFVHNESTLLTGGGFEVLWRSLPATLEELKVDFRFFGLPNAATADGAVRALARQFPKLPSLRVLSLILAESASIAAAGELIKALVLLPSLQDLVLVAACKEAVRALLNETLHGDSIRTSTKDDWEFFFQRVQP